MVGSPMSSGHGPWFSRCEGQRYRFGVVLSRFSLIVMGAENRSTVSEPRGDWLVQATEQTPSTVLQLPTIEPSSVEKTAAVPSGAGLLNLSASRTLISVVLPSAS